MYCEKCGNEVKEDASFCQNCGTSLSNAQSIQPVNLYSTPSIESKPFWKTKKAIKTLLIIGVVVIGVFLKIFYFVDNEAVNKSNSGLTSFNSGNSEQAISQFQQASNDAVSNDTKRNTLINLAYVYASEGKNDLSLKTFKEAVVLAEKDSFDYYLILGEIDLMEKRPDKALLNYNSAYQLKPNDFQINNALNLFYLDLDGSASKYANYAKALNYAQKAYEVSDDMVKNIARQNLALAYFFNKNFDQALPLFLACNSVSDPSINYWIGLTYLGKDDAINAKVYLQRAKNAGVPIEPEIAKYLD